MEMALDLHLKPWEIEAECTESWWKRYWAYNRAMNKAAKSKQTVKVE